jgi:hypothetical protein
MTEAKHTQGPWHFGGWEGFEGLIHDEESCIIANPGEDAAVWPANARLIAAAPDLAKAGKAMSDRECRYDGNDIVIPCGSHGEAIKLMADMRAAIAKAEGTTDQPDSPQPSHCAEFLGLNPEDRSGECA